MTRQDAIWVAEETGRPTRKPAWIRHVAGFPTALGQTLDQKSPGLHRTV